MSKIASKFIVRCPNGQRWWCEAVSLKAAINEIGMAMATGSVGSESRIDETRVGGTEWLRAKVNRINSDNTFQQPYTKIY